MKRVIGFLAIAALFVVAPPARGRGGAEVPSRLKLAIDLRDGSHLIGVPELITVPVRTSYARMSVPIEEIATVAFEDDRETATFRMGNGDVIKGVYDLGPIRLHMAFGPVVVPVAQIATVTVLLGGARLPVVHYSFDDDPNGQALDSTVPQHNATVSPGVEYRTGIRGKGIVTSGRHTYVLCNDPKLDLNGWRQLTVSLWMRVDRFATYGRIFSRFAPGAPGGFGLTVGGNHGGKRIDGNFWVRLADKSSKTVEIERFAQQGKWHHVAGVYDGTFLRYYVDGEQAAVREVSPEHRHAALYEERGADLIIGKCGNRRDWSDTHINGMLDEVMIFDTALSATDVKRLYESALPE